jgi:adenylate kinase
MMMVRLALCYVLCIVPGLVQAFLPASSIRQPQNAAGRHDGWMESSFSSLTSTPHYVSHPKRTSSSLLAAVNIIIAGAPASGKGTQCETIKEKFGVVHLSTGDMLRAAVSAGSEVGKLAKDYMDSGKLVPDEVIIGVVKGRLEEEDCKNQGWLLDGFPRTQAQAKALEEAGVSANCFLFLDVPDEILVERVVGRRTDPVTGKIYHMKFSPPSDPDILARLEQRSDDTEEKVKVRLEQFHTNVGAVKDSYSDIMVTIDGNRAPAEVSTNILETIERMSSLNA